MKKFINILLCNYAIMVIIVGAGFVFLGTGEFRTSLLFELFVTLLPVRLIAAMMDKYLSNSKYFVLNHLFDYIAAMLFYLLAWRIFGWHERISIWFMIISIAAICVGMFLLVLRKTKQDIVYINEQLKQRRDKKKVHTK